MNPTSIYSKTGKGVQEASGKTSQLSRGDRAILSAIDGKTNLKELSAKFDRAPDERFFSLIKKLDVDGFIREVSPGTVERGAARSAKPAPTAPAAPAAAAKSGGDDLDFTQIFSAPPKVDKPTADPMAAARQEAELRARAEREAKAKAEAAAKAQADAAMKERLEAEARAKAAREMAMQAAAEGKTKAEIEARMRAESDAKARAAMEEKLRADAEARAKLEAERLAKERLEREAREAKESVEREAREAKERAELALRAKAEAAERARFEAAERARREAEELRRKVEAERRAREEAERRAREEAERTKREAEERARREAEERKAREEAEALRIKLEEERKAREAAERKAQEEREKRERERDAELQKLQALERKEAEEHQHQIRLAREAEDRKRREADARKKKEEDARRWEQEEARRKSDDAYRLRAEQEDKERAAREAEEAAARAEAEKKAAAAADALAGSLMADLESFSKREDDERKENEARERKEREERLRIAKQEAEQREREEAERKARKAEEKRRREEEERKAKAEEERRAQEEEAKKQEAIAEKKRKEREAEARKKDDIPISRADLGMDDVAEDARKLTPEARKALRDREREVTRLRARGDQPSAKAAKAYKRKQPVHWGRPLALSLLVLLVLGVGVLNFLPLATGEYEKMASEAMGAPVKIGSARLWVLTGVQIRLERVQVGESIRVAEVRAVPEISALLEGRKAFSRFEIDKLVLPQEALGGVLFGSMKGGELRVGRVVAKALKLEGPLALPALDVDAVLGGDGRLVSAQLAGENTSGQLASKGDSVTFEATLGSFTLPFLEKTPITEFGMKGSANRQGMTLSEFDGRLYDGTVVGNARIQWGEQWSWQGEVQGRAMNAGVFSPQMISEGRFEGKGRFALAGPDPAKLGEGARLEGTFTVTKGTLASFDLSRALQTASAQASGRTSFAELAGSVALAGGALAFRDLKLTSGILGATGSLDVDPSGALSGRVNAELRNLRGTFYIGGKLQDPQLRR